MIDHIDASWRTKLNRDMGYPFTGKDMSDLRYFSGKFQTWMVAALWDEYLDAADTYTLKHACDVYTFTRNLPRLMDSRTYKAKARLYETKWAPPLPPEITDLFSAIKTGLPKDDKSKKF